MEPLTRIPEPTTGAISEDARWRNRRRRHISYGISALFGAAGGIATIAETNEYTLMLLGASTAASIISGTIYNHQNKIRSVVTSLAYGAALYGSVITMGYVAPEISNIATDIEMSNVRDQQESERSHQEQQQKMQQQQYQRQQEFEQKRQLDDWNRRMNRKEKSWLEKLIE